MKHSMKPKRRDNNVEDVQSEAARAGTSTSVDEKINETDNMLKNHNVYDANYDSDYDDVEDNYAAVITDDHSLRELERFNVQVHSRFHQGMNNYPWKPSKRIGSERIKNSFWLKPSVMHN